MPVNSFEDYPITWKPTIQDRTAPIYTQLAKQLAQDIQAGILKPGDKLPPQRELADYLDLHLSTVTRVYKLCEERGLICAKVGQGTFVSSDVTVSDTLLYPDESFDWIQLGTVLPPDNGNQRVIEFIKEILSQPDIRNFLEYGSPSGTHTQRTNFSRWVESIGITTTPENVLLATGGQNALCATLLGLFSPGDRIGTSPLSFSGLKAISKMIGIQLVPLPEKDGLLQCDMLEQFCRHENLKGLYFVPEQHNPTTYTMSTEERKQISGIAKRLGIIIIEDAVNRMLSSGDHPSLFSFAPDNTVYIFSTSKFLSPGLRVAYLLVPEQYKERLENALYNMNLMVSPFCAEIVNRIFNSELLDYLIAAKKRELIGRDAIVNTHFGDLPIRGEPTCNFRWLMLPEQWSGQAFENAAKGVGVQVFCAERFSIGNIVPPKAVRICISAPKTRTELNSGLQRIERLLYSMPEKDCRLMR